MSARSLALAFLAAGIAVPALAQPPIPDRPIPRAEVIAGVKRQFAAMDANHDGSVSRAEFEAYRARTADAPQDSAFGHVGGKWFDKADADANGRVTLAEAEARPLQLFDMADTDRDGVISRSERQTAMMFMALGGK